jgi:hypothetical protein
VGAVVIGKDRSEVLGGSALVPRRDPNNFGKQWRKVRDRLGVPAVDAD